MTRGVRAQKQNPGTKLHAHDSTRLSPLHSCTLLYMHGPHPSTATSSPDAVAQTAHTCSEHGTLPVLR